VRPHGDVRVDVNTEVADRGDRQSTVLNGSRDLTTPLSGMVCHPWASNCYDQIWKAI